MSELDIHVLHDEAGRILAIAPASATIDEQGRRRGVTPVPTAGQFAIRLTLADEHAALGPVAIVRDFRIDLAAETPSLRAR